ncbi:hypothetical protein BaRGS_00005352 [Batillaria attramentaria]|uniref:Uncharacterized protein n=1 Tax=Batillaria attramentaria TaxID=370345 RepID=A0ABD0LWE1_9CAEN
MCPNTSQTLSSTRHRPQLSVPVDPVGVIKGPSQSVKMIDTTVCACSLACIHQVAVQFCIDNSSSVLQGFRNHSYTRVHVGGWVLNSERCSPPPSLHQAGRARSGAGASTEHSPLPNPPSPPPNSLCCGPGAKGSRQAQEAGGDKGWNPNPYSSRGQSDKDKRFELLSFLQSLPTLCGPQGRAQFLSAREFWPTEACSGDDDV